MKLVVQVKLLPTPVQAASLEATLHACNEAATWAGGVAFEKDVKSNFALREHTYDEIKARRGLGAQAAQHVIKKTCDAYATLKANLRAGNLGRPDSKRYRRAVEKPVVFRPEGAQPYDDRMLSWQMDRRRISIWTTAGRIKDVAFTASPEQLATLALYRRGESDLLRRDGMWFLNATCDVPEAPPNSDPVDFLGIDLVPRQAMFARQGAASGACSRRAGRKSSYWTYLGLRPVRRECVPGVATGRTLPVAALGIVNIATTSDGEIMAGRELNRIRTRERLLRTKLQKKNTPVGQTPTEETATQGSAAGQGHQSQDREAYGGRG
ncbi:hypothetical protein ACFV2H_40855 [Streptomyces sp. NPDC059629]|uniref:hypothetical protein n=1 Tax=Streptomyces sp. NPDC059629 TaxID=3346889 RepID=UPI00367EF254